MKKALDKKKILMVLLFVLMVAVQLARIIYVFNQREGYHSDEVWSYGFANSYYDPHIYLQINEDPFLLDATNKNLNEWVSGRAFWDYLVVNDGEAFAYDSVYYGQRRDMSPPLHTMILHTICSFFPNTFSWWYAFSINIVAFILTQIVFYALVKTVTGTNWAAFLVCGYYGFTSAAVNTFIYLRQYALLTVITLLLLYLLARMYRKNFHKMIPECILSIVVTALGGLTHYYFYVFACFLAGFTCFYLLFHRRWKSLIGYALTMLAGAGMGILIYPYCLMNMINGYHLYDGNLQFPYYWNLTTCLSLVLNETIGLTWGVNRVTFAWLSILIPSLAAILLAVWFVCRKEVWMIRLLQRIREWLRNWKSNCKRVISGWNPFLIFIFLSVVLSIMIIAKVSDVEAMQGFTDRYLFFIMPVFWMLLCLFLLYLGRRYLPGKKLRISVCAILILLCMTLNQLGSVYRAIFPTDSEEKPLWELTEDSDVIIAGVRAWKMEWYAYELRNAHSFFMTEGDDCINCAEQLNSYVPEEDRDVYVIIEELLLKSDDESEDELIELGNIDSMYSFGNSVTEERYLDYLQQEVDWIDSVEFMYERNSFCGNLHIYKIHVKGE